jgi:hypothetical protein
VHLIVSPINDSILLEEVQLIHCGVSKGSVPYIIFIIYANELNDCISQPSVISYAEDKTLFLSRKWTNDS